MLYRILPHRPLPGIHHVRFRMFEASSTLLGEKSEYSPIVRRVPGSLLLKLTAQAVQEDRLRKLQKHSLLSPDTPTPHPTHASLQRAPARVPTLTFPGHATRLLISGLPTDIEGAVLEIKLLEAFGRYGKIQSLDIGTFLFYLQILEH